MTPLGDVLAVRTRAESDRLAEAHDDIEAGGPDQLQEMRGQIHVAVPGDHRPVGASDRYTVDGGVGDGDRLHGDLPGAGSGTGSAEQGAAKGQDPVAVARGALCEEHDDVAAADPRGYRLGLRYGLRPAGAV